MTENEEHTADQVAQQRVIDAVLASHGGRHEDEVLDELTARLQEADQTGTTGRWREAVAAEISLGNVYVVSRTTIPVIEEEVSGSEEASEQRE